MHRKGKDLAGVTDGISRDDVLLLGLVGAGAVWLGILNPGDILAGLGRWLLEHQLLVPSQESLIPLFAGLGLGGAQLGIIAGILIAVLALLGLRRHAKQQAEGRAPQR